MDNPDTSAVRTYLLELQDSICAALQAEDGDATFVTDTWNKQLPTDGAERDDGGGITRTLADGAVFEKAGVAFSHVRGAELPSSATNRRPELRGRPWEALGVSIVVHPRNPYVPTSHANVRFLCAHPAPGMPGVPNVAIEQPIWWFGGGFDLTPYYGFDADCVHWHRTARDAVRPFGDEMYPRLKAWCDEYFQLKHRNEPRGIGGVFFDDFNELGFERSFALARAVGNAFIPAFRPIVARRKATPHGERERRFQLHRRGRYVEFNLVWDRGTLFGLQSGGRTESVLMSMPPLARWDYGWNPERGSPEARLYEHFLKPRNWADDALE